MEYYTTSRETGGVPKFCGFFMVYIRISLISFGRKNISGPNEATGCHTVGLLNKILVAGGPYLSDNLAGFVARVSDTRRDI